MNIAVGIPVAPENTANASTVAIASGWEHACGAKLVIEPSPSPEEGRDKIVYKVNYMIPRPTHILFMDADVVPRKNTLKTLMSHDKDIICGMYPMFQKDNFYWSVYHPEKSSRVLDRALPNNPFKIEMCGFGMVLVKTSVFDVLEWPYWRSEYAPGLRTLGEDIYFCNKARSAGFDIWCDPKIRCDHVTRASYLKILRNMKG